MGMTQVPEDFLKSVVFLTLDHNPPAGSPGRPVRRPIGTGFFVRVPHEDGRPNNGYDYVVTAAHCVKPNHSDVPLFVRMNLANGKFLEVPTKPDEWFFHPAADVAAVYMGRFRLPTVMKAEDFDIVIDNSDRASWATA